MSIQKGDFILVDYVGRVKETREVFDTTLEDIARKEKIFKEGEVYEPKLIAVGEGWVLKALDETFLRLKMKKKDTVEISPEEGFGTRDPEKVKLVPLRRLIARGITPNLGMQLEYDGKLATVRTIGSGRVQLDFNPPLAGKTLIYEVTVLKKLKTSIEKISALIHRRISAVDVEKFKFKIGKSNVTINVPEETFYLEGIQLVKRGIATDIQKFFSETSTVKFTEIFKKRKTNPR